MYKYLALLVSAIFCCAQCLPLNATHSESTSSSEMHLIVNNSTQSTNYHITPVASVLEDIDQEIDDQLKAILPYLNFFFDSLLGPSKSADDDDSCVNDMVIELVPDETARPPASPTTDDKPQPEDKTEPKPIAAGKSDEKSADDKSAPNPDVVSAPEKPAKNVVTNP